MVKNTFRVEIMRQSATAPKIKIIVVFRDQSINKCHFYFFNYIFEMLLI